MSRIFYFTRSNGGVAGGLKVMLRHVEALRTLGFDAACYGLAANPIPPWFEHEAPVLNSPRLADDDILVVPDDMPVALTNLAPTSQRVVVLAQNPYLMAEAGSLDALDRFPPERQPPILAVSEELAATMRRLYPRAVVDVIPCFADERRFAPAAKTRGAVYVPRKRPTEAKAIRALFSKLHPGQADLPWLQMDLVTETAMAAAMARGTLFVSLSRLESVGMTPLEAMASGCLCTGFLGVGGRAFATPDNGLWVPDEDCEAAADAVAEADALVRAGGPKLQARLEAGYETARTWSHARFRERLEAVWTRLAPDARL